MTPRPKWHSPPMSTASTSGGVLIPFASAYNTRAWLYVPDYASHDAPPAFVYEKRDGVEVWRLAITAG